MPVRVLPPTAASRVDGRLMSAFRARLPEARGSRAARSGSAYGKDQSGCRGAAIRILFARAVVASATGSVLPSLPWVGTGVLASPPWLGVGVAEVVGTGVVEKSGAPGSLGGPRIAGSIAQVTCVLSVPAMTRSRREPVSYTH